MYQNFYGLRELPFELTPNPKYLFLPPQHREALSALEYGLSSAKPITVLIGEAGTGKTTLIHAALESERCRGVRCVYVNNTSPNGSHAPPHPSRVRAIVRNAPSVTSMRITRRLLKNPTDRLSADQKGNAAPSVPSSFRAVREFSARTHKVARSFGLRAQNATCEPSGDAAGGPEKSPVKS